MFAFQTTFKHVILHQPREQELHFILPRQQNRADRFPSRSISDVILKQNCRENCSLLDLIDFRWLYYILIRLSAINIADYLFLPTKYFNRGRLISNSNLHLNLSC